MHVKKMNPKKLFVGICLLLVTLVYAFNMLVIGGVTAAYTPATGDTIRFEYSPGYYYDDTHDQVHVQRPAQVSFTTTTQSATVNSSGSVIIPCKSFESLGLTYTGTSTNCNNNGYAGKEIFEFGTDSAGNKTKDGNLEYAFTGWKISGTQYNIPGETVFQPGDVITENILKEYVGANNTIKFEALWARCYFVRNRLSDYTLKEVSGKFEWDNTNKEYKLTSGSSPWKQNFNSTTTFNETTLWSGNYWGQSFETIDAAFWRIRIDQQKKLSKLSGTAKTNYVAQLHDAYLTTIVLYNDETWYKRSQVNGEVDANKNLIGDVNYFGYSGAAISSADVTQYNSETGKAADYKPYENTVAGHFAQKGEVSVTFKSANKSADQEGYTIYYKQAALTSWFYGNLRFDNVNIVRAKEASATDADQYYADQNTQKNKFEQLVGFELHLDEGAYNKQNSYIDFTYRFNSTYTAKTNKYTSDTNDKPPYRTWPGYIRTHQYRNACINGGVIQEFYLSYAGGPTWHQHSAWRIRNWYFGRYAVVHGNVIFGTGSGNTNACTEVAGVFNLYMTGGNIANIKGGSVNVNALCIGDRNLNICGDEGYYNDPTKTLTNCKVYGNASNHNYTLNPYSPTVNGSVVGGGNGARIYGDINLKLNAATVKNNVYGGGEEATATVFGNVYVDINNSKIGSNLYGGGKNGNVEVVGDTYKYYLEQKCTDTGEFDPTQVGPNTNVFEYTYAIEGTGDAHGYPATNNGWETVETNGVKDGDGNLVGKKNRPLSRYADQCAYNTDWGKGKGGDVFLTVKNSSVGTNVYGASSGASRAYDVADRKYWTPSTIVDRATYNKNPDSYKANGCYIKPVMNGTTVTTAGEWVYNEEIRNWLNAPPSDYPKLTTDGAILSRVRKSFAYNGHKPLEFTYMTTYTYLELALAYVENVTMNIENSTIGNNVYGGGSLANVNKDVNIVIDGSTIGNNVYGGGDGGAPGGQTVYSPTGKYTSYPTIVPKSYNSSQLPNAATPTNGTGFETNNGTFNWTNDPALKSSGVDIAGKRIYSENYGEYGKVVGDINLTVNNTTVLGSNLTDGHVYGGGNQGKVDGDITLDLTGTTRVTQTVIGGSSKADVKGDVTLTLKDNILVHNDVYAGNHTGGNITGQVTVNVEDNAHAARVYGGGYKADYSGTPIVNVKGGMVMSTANRPEANGDGDSYTGLFGGGAYGSVGGTDVNVTGGEVTNLYGGANYSGSAVKGNVDVDITGGKVDYIYGGSSEGSVTGNVALDIYSSGSTTPVVGSAGGKCIFGGGLRGPVNGKVTFNLNVDVTTSASDLYIYGGGSEGDVLGGIEFNVEGTSSNQLTFDADVDNVDENGNNKVLSAANLFGGCNNATVKGGTVLNIKHAYIDGFAFGANHLGGTVDNSRLNMLDGSFITDKVYGGGNAAPVSGTSSLYLLNGSYCENDAYGGGYGSAATSKNTYVFTEDGMEIDNWLYGGGRSAAVTGGTVMDLTGGELKNRVLGGGFEGSVGSVDMNISGGNFQMYYKDRGITGGGDSGDVIGDVRIDVTGGTFRDILGGSRSADVGGNVYITIDGGTFKEDSTNGSNIYGGCESAGTVTGNVNITINNNAGGIDAVYGGGYGSADNTVAVNGTANVTINDSANVAIPLVCGGAEGVTGMVAADVANTNVTLTKGTVTELYGGGNMGNVTENAVVNLNGGTIKSYVFGGGNAGDVLGNVTLNMAGDAKVDNPDWADHHGDARTYGGGRNGDVYGTITCNFGGNSARYGYTFGGSLAGDVGLNYKDATTYTDVITVNYTDTTKNHSTSFGGNNQLGTVYGNVVVNYNSTGSFGQVHGGNNGNNTDGITGATGATIKGNVTVNIEDGTFQNSQYGVFGGSNEKGTIDGDILVNITGGDVKGNIYGGGNNTPHAAKATVYVAPGVEVCTGTPTSTNEKCIYGAGNGATAHVETTEINFHGIIANNIYGGGRNATAGTTTVNIFNGASADNVYGGGYGREAVNNNGSTSTATNVNMSGGTVNYIYGGGQGATAVVGTASAPALSTVAVSGGTVNHNVFGGGNAGNTIGNTDVTVSGGTVTEDVYGGANIAEVDGNTAVTIAGGTVGNVYSADMSSDVTAVAGGGLQGAVTGDTSVTVTAGNVKSYVYGGGYNGNVGGNTAVTVSGGTVYGHVFGGSRSADIGTEGDGDDKGNVNVLINGGVLDQQLYGGNNHAGTVNGNVTTVIEGTATINNNIYFGNNGNGHGGEGDYATTADIPGAVITGNVNGTINGGSILNNVYCASNEKGVINGDVIGNINSRTNKSVYGGGFNAPHYGNVYLNISETGDVGNNVFGGGNNAYVGRTYIVSKGQIATNGGENFFFGGGNNANVGAVNVEIDGGRVYRHLYGGGNNGSVDSVEIDVYAGQFDGDINGGGKNGTVRVTNVYITDGGKTAGADTSTVVSGNVYGGGEGATATVYESTNVVIDMAYDFAATEAAVTTQAESVPSGEAATTITPDASYLSVIKGSVYGGGDLGAVGEGSIIAGQNKANIISEGTSTVTVNNGHILGSVFGGGRGKPAEGTSYKATMGVIYGSTDVNFLGGHVETSIYGGGEQSRVYAVTDGTASTVDVDCNIIEGSKIAIGKSVFGGGDRGSGTAINASVPTTIGNVVVNINGNANGTPIYFDGTGNEGGVYGDGNLCIVNGERTININDFVTGDDEFLKTFYSVQRADTVNLNNAEIVLLGALDLVEEGDDSVYSVNRVGHMYMNDGSTVKLDQLVKYLGGLESDYTKDTHYTARPYIFKGFNFITNAYEGHGGTELDVLALNATEVKNYIRNDITVAEHDEHNILCVANGLYVDVMKEDDTWGPVTGLFTLQLLHAVPGQGGGFVYSDIETSTGDFICTTPMQNESGAQITGTEETGLTYVSTDGGPAIMYMDVIDNVGKYSSSSPTYDYYYWYINGGNISYDMDIKAFVGTDDTAFSDSSTLPAHTEEYRYVLEDIEDVNGALKEYLTAGTYNLVQTSSVTGTKDIAIEYRVGGKSLGFVKYVDDKLVLVTPDNHEISGMQGVREGDANFVSQLTANSILTTALIEGTNDIECVIHRSSDITKTTVDDIEVKMTLKLFQKDHNAPPDDRAHIFTVNSNFSLVRVNPTQNVYYESIRNYVGLSTQSPIYITKESAFTVEFKTRYIPRTFGTASGDSMSWAFNTTTAFPAGTKLSMVDMTDGTPTYYYYICDGSTTTVDLNNFMQMGTKTKISDMATKPAFMAVYNDQTSEIVTERMLFVVDFHDVQTGNFTWSGDVFKGKVSLSHTYASSEIMNYTDDEGNPVTPATAEFNVHKTERGAKTLEFDFTQDSYPNKGIADFTTTLTEGEWVDTRFYEGEFAFVLELVDEYGNVLDLPQGIMFEANGETYRPALDNNQSIVLVSSFGKHKAAINTTLYGIREALGVGDTVRFKASLYSAPDADYYHVIDTTLTDQDSYTIGEDVEHALKVVSPLKVTNLILSQGETLDFTLKTWQENDPTTTVSVECYAKTDDGYTQRVNLASIFNDSAEILQPTHDEATGERSYSGTVTNDAKLGMYRLVFKYAEHTEYIYFIID